MQQTIGETIVMYTRSVYPTSQEVDDILDCLVCVFVIKCKTSDGTVETDCTRYYVK